MHAGYWVLPWMARLIAQAFSAHYSWEAHYFMANSNDGTKTEASIDTIWILGNPECLWSVGDWFNFTKSILFHVYRRICGAIANNLSGRYMNYLLVWNWAPLGKMINFGFFDQRNALNQWSNDPSLDHADQWSNDPSLDHADQWSDESLSRVDLIDHWSENGFARKERHRSEILIRILPKERTLSQREHFFLVSNHGFKTYRS